MGFNATQFFEYGKSRGCTDVDAKLFFTNVGITDATQQKAICTLVTSLKTNNLWDKLNAIYPFVGGTAATHKYNLKNPLNTDAVFRLYFSSVAIVHSSSGVLFNGSSYANTFYNPSVRAVFNDEHISLYSTTNNTPTTSDSVDMGSHNNGTQASLITLRGTSAKNMFNGKLNATAYGISNTDAKGFYLVSKISNGISTIYKNGVLKNSGVGGGTLPTASIFIGALGLNGTAYGACNQNYAFATMGKGLTDVESLTLYNIVQAYQTILGRQV